MYMVFQNTGRCIFYSLLKKFRKPEAALLLLFFNFYTKSFRKLCKDFPEAGTVVFSKPDSQLTYLMTAGKGSCSQITERSSKRKLFQITAVIKSVSPCFL